MKALRELLMLGMAIAVLFVMLYVAVGQIPL